MDAKKGKNMRPPSFPFYVKDYLGDTELRRCHRSTRGIWMDLLCFMWEADDQGRLDDTPEGLASLSGAPPDEMVLFFRDALATGFCKIDEKFADFFENSYRKTHRKSTDWSHLCQEVWSQLCHTPVTVVNRRMFRGAKRRLSQRERQRRSRMSKRVAPVCHTSVTPPDKKPVTPDVTPNVTALSHPKNTPPAFASASAVHVNDKSLTPETGQGPAQGSASQVRFDLRADMASHVDELVDLANEAQSRPHTSGRQFRSFAWIQDMTNKGKHPAAQIYALQSTLDNWGDIDIPWAWATKVVKSTDGRFKGDELKKQAQNFKKTVWPEKLKELAKNEGRDIL